MADSQSTFVEILADRIQEVATSDDLPSHHAWARVAAETLGYDVESCEFFERNDSGIDFYHMGDSIFEVFQCKLHESNDPLGVDASQPFDPEGVRDLGRAFDFLLGELKPHNIDPRLDSLKARLREELELLRETLANTEDSVPKFTVNFVLVTLGDKLQPGTHDAMKHLKAKLRKHATTEPGLQLGFQHLGIKELAEFFEDPSRTAKGQKDTMDLHVGFRGPREEDSREKLISANDFVTFYAPAADLVVASKKLGPALFDANVRYELKRSNVNEEIKRSAMHPKTMKVFHLYNNGVTIVADNWPFRQKTYFQLLNPSVINGCQTVRSLVEAERSLREDEEANKFALQVFQEKCCVLVRMIRRGAVDIEEVVRAANTQNLMEPRNLLGNRNEQRHFDAVRHSATPFRGDAKRPARLRSKWPSLKRPVVAGFRRPLTNKRRQHFVGTGSAGLYSMIFLSRPKTHAALHSLECGGKEADVMVGDRPPAGWLLYSAHLLQVVKEILPKATDLRSEVRKVLRAEGVEPGLAVVNERIMNDEALRLRFALSMLDHVILELTGFCFARALKDAWLSLDAVKKALILGVVGHLHEHGDLPESLKRRSVLELGYGDLKADPALIGVRLAVSAVKSTLRAPEYQEGFCAAERKCRYLQGQLLRRDFARSIDKYDRYMAEPGHLEDWWKGSAPLSAIRRMLI